jgi:hypothetical protein
LLSGDICPYLLATGWFVAFGARFKYKKITNLVPLVVADSGESSAGSANDFPSAVVTSADALFDVLAQVDASHETSSEGITSTVQVNDIRLAAHNRGEFVHLAVVEDEGGIGTLREDHHALALSILLGQSREALSNVLQVVLVPALTLAKSGGLALVAHDDVSVGQHFLHLVPEEFDQEGRGNVEREQFVGLSSVLTELHEGLRADSQEEGGGVVVLARVQQLLSGFLAEVSNVVQVSSSQVSDEATLVVLDQHGASTSAFSVCHGVSKSIRFGASSIDLLVTM